MTSAPGDSVVRFETPADNPGDELAQIQISRKGMIRRLDVKVLGGGETIVDGRIRQVKRFVVTL